MNRTEAETHVLMLRTAFSNERWDAPTIQFWVTHFERLEHPEIAYAVVEKVIEEEQRRPAWSVIRQAYRAEASRRAEAASRARGLGDGREHGIPTWVYVWAWARQYREPRLDADTRLPQQEYDPEEEHGRTLTFMSEKEYEALHAEWVAAGAPRHDPRAMVGAA